MVGYSVTVSEEKMQNDEKFHSDYTTFMKNYFIKGYTTESTSIKTSSCWYIPHHDVYHPHKPDKIRLLIDCGSEFKQEEV